MKEYTFTMTRTDTGKVTVTAANEREAIEKAHDYTGRIVMVNERSWQDSRIIRHKLEEAK